jgi:hypothetical protein
VVSAHPHACEADHLLEPHEKSAEQKRCQCDSRSNFLPRFSEVFHRINRLTTGDLQTRMPALIKPRQLWSCYESKRRLKNAAVWHHFRVTRMSDRRAGVSSTRTRACLTPGSSPRGAHLRSTSYPRRLGNAPTRLTSWMVSKSGAGQKAPACYPRRARASAFSARSVQRRANASMWCDPNAMTSVPLPRDTSRLGDGTRRLLLLG